jgi:hypothetical protein
VPQQQRLQQCALACKAWASAAALATCHVEHVFKAQGPAIPACESWLQKYAGQLISLQLAFSCSKSDEYHNLQIPWAKLTKLQRLQLECLQLQLPGELDSGCSSQAHDGAEASSSCEDGTHSPAALLLPSLQHLDLSVIKFNSISSLQQLAAGATGLTSLKTNHISFVQLDYCSYRTRSNSDAATQQVAAAIPSLLKQLPQLAVLELPGFPMSAAAMQQLGGMRELQELHLEQVVRMPAYKLQDLPSKLTQLHFHGKTPEDGFPIDSSCLPDELLQLAGVLQLRLDRCYILPTVLGALTRLQVLNLHCAVLPKERRRLFVQCRRHSSAARCTVWHDLPTGFGTGRGWGRFVEHSPAALCGTDGFHTAHSAGPVPADFCPGATGRRAVHVS